jgi:S1-C subfamily serine protease
MTEKGVRRTGGQIAADPLKDAPIGAQLQISADLFACSPVGNLDGIINWDFFEGAIVALHFGQSGLQHILGSGVLVAPGVVMAARHVIEAQEQQLRRGEQELICSGITADGLVLWRCRGVTLLGNSDIALLMVEAASVLPKILRQVTLTTRMPRVGEKIVIVGVRHHADSPVDIAAEMKLSMMAASGEVTARYEQRRDSVLLPHPCFEVNCAATGGMSGGPAFDEKGFLVGLVTSSIDGELAGPTFLSLPWPAFSETINPIWPAGFYKGATSLLKMDRRICGIHRPEAIEIHEDRSGQPIATYHHWDIERA